MVSDERVDMAAGFCGLFFERHEQVHHFARIGAAIEHVAGLYEVRFAAGPAVPLIDQSGGAQDVDACLVISMDIADSHHPLDAGPDVLRREEAAGCEKNQDQDEHGRVRLTVVPLPSRLWIRISPPCSLMNWREVNKLQLPVDTRPSATRNPGSKMRASRSAGMPRPLSSILTSRLD